MSTIAVIGGGPAGYVAALTSARKGLKTIVIEEGEVGGTCLNHGCIPTKALVKSASIYSLLKSAHMFGVASAGGEVDWEQVQGRKGKIVEGLCRGLQSLMKDAGIRVIQGKAAFQAEHKLEVISKSGDVSLLDIDRIIIASGSTVKSLKECAIDEKNILSSKGILAIPQLPQSLLVIGGGVIGLEFANIFNMLGVEVTVVEALPRILPGIDEEAGSLIAAHLGKRGVKFKLSTKVLRVDHLSNKICVQLQTSKGIEEVVVDKILVAVGRIPNISELRLDKAGVTVEKGQIKVDKSLKTSVEGIYAAGDVIGNPMLAHAAFIEGATVAMAASGETVELQDQAIPVCVYTIPEVAQVGLTEKEARELYGNVKIGKYPLRANGKALIEGEGGEEGFIKIIGDGKYGEVLGVVMVGPHATELIGLGVLAINSELTIEQLADIVQAHPTVCEAVREAALMAVGRPLHI